MARSFDVIVVGGGVSGLSIAVELGRNGLSVCLIDPKSKEWGGASKAAGAMIDAFGENSLRQTPEEKHLLELRLAGMRNFPDWLEKIEALSSNSVHKNEGMFIIGNSGGDHDIEHFELLHRLMDEYQETYEITNPNKVPGLNPNVTCRAHSATFMPGALSVDSASLLNNLNIALSNVPTVESITASARSVEHMGSRWTTRLDNGDSLEAPQVVLAAGARCTSLVSDGLRREAGIPSVYYGRGISCLTTQADPLPYAIRTPNRALSCGIHIVPRLHGQIYLGASNLFGMDLNLPKGPSVGELHSMLGTLCNQINTSLRNVSVDQFNWGLRPVTVDGLPLIGHTLIDGLYLATGMHRVGVNIAPVTQDVVCSAILKRKASVSYPFAIGRAKNLRKSHDVNLGIRSLIATALYPDGYLPYNRSQELEIFISELFKIVIDNNSTDGLQRRIIELYNHIDMDEQAMIRVFHEILHQKIPSKGPYPI